MARLVVSRKAGQVLYVGDVAVLVVAVKGNSVKLLIDAPEEVSVDREEVRTAKEAGRKTA